MLKVLKTRSYFPRLLIKKENDIEEKKRVKRVDWERTNAQRSPSLLRNEAKRSIPRTAGHGSMEMNFTFGRVWFCVLRCVGHGYRAVRFPTGRPPTRRARTKTLSRERDSFDRCRSFTGNRVSHAPFFVTKRKAMIVYVCARVNTSLVERLAKSDSSCVGLPSFSATR